MAYSLAAYSNASLVQQMGSLSRVACLLLRATTDFMNAVTEKLSRYCIINLSPKGPVSHIPSGLMYFGKIRCSQHLGSRLALYHDLHTKGTSKSNDSIPTLRNTFTKQSMFSSSHFRPSILANEKGKTKRTVRLNLSWNQNWYYDYY